jgi:hypothetical protein
MVSRQAKRQAVEVLQAAHGFRVMRASGLSIHASEDRYHSTPGSCCEDAESMLV